MGKGRFRHWSSTEKERPHHRIHETRQKRAMWTLQMLTGLKKVEHSFNCGKEKKMREKVQKAKYTK